MRSVKYGALVFGILLCTACGGGEDAAKPAQAPPSPPSVSVNSATNPTDTTTTTPAEAPKASLADMQAKSAKAALDALNAHDADKLASLYADTFVVRMAGMPDVTSKDTMKQQMQMEFAAFPDAKYAFGRTWQKNDVMVVEYGMTGTNTGDFMGMKATNKPVGLRGVTVIFSNPDGLVREEHDYTDMGSMMMQLGVPKAKGRALVGLPTTSETHIAKGTPDEDKNVDLAKSFAAVMEKKDVKAFLDGMTDDSTYDMNVSPNPMSGKKDGEKWFNMMTKAFPDMKSTISNAWGVEDYVIDEYTMTGTQKGAITGPMGTIPATGKQVNLHGIEIVQFKDGKMTHGWGFENGAEFATQLGLMKPPGQAPAGGGAKGGAKAPAAPAPAAPAPAKK
jgi:steroid delta-isomerase-like uncharacterized protein